MSCKDSGLTPGDDDGCTYNCTGFLDDCPSGMDCIDPEPFNIFNPTWCAWTN